MRIPTSSLTVTAIDPVWIVTAAGVAGVAALTVIPGVVELPAPTVPATEYVPAPIGTLVNVNVFPAPVDPVAE